jgi:ABC-2 type transport system permease protein
LPIILTVLPLVILYATRSAGDFMSMTTSDMPASFSQFCEGMDAAECGQYFFVSQFMLLFMLLPLAIPVTIASYSIVGEKATRTLEPLLATPVKTFELLLGKGLAAALPAIAATWLGFAVFALGTAVLAVGQGVLARLMDPMWLIAVFVVGPLLAIAAVNVAVMVSSRATDPRVAEQLSMLVVLPLLFFFFGQITGLILLNETIILWMAFALVAIDLGLLWFATNLFQRENILTRWK